VQPQPVHQMQKSAPHGAPAQKPGGGAPPPQAPPAPTPAPKAPAAPQLPPQAPASPPAPPQAPAPWSLPLPQQGPTFTGGKSPYDTGGAPSSSFTGNGAFQAGQPTPTPKPDDGSAIPLAPPPRYFPPYSEGAKPDVGGGPGTSPLTGGSAPAPQGAPFEPHTGDLPASTWRNYDATSQAYWDALHGGGNYGVSDDAMKGKLYQIQEAADQAKLAENDAMAGRGFASSGAAISDLGGIQQKADADKANLLLQNALSTIAERDKMAGVLGGLGNQQTGQLLDQQKFSDYMHQQAQESLWQALPNIAALLGKDKVFSPTDLSQFMQDLSAAGPDMSGVSGVVGNLGAAPGSSLSYNQPYKKTAGSDATPGVSVDIGPVGDYSGNAAFQQQYGPDGAKLFQAAQAAFSQGGAAADWYAQEQKREDALHAADPNVSYGSPVTTAVTYYNKHHKWPWE